MRISVNSMARILSHIIGIKKEPQYEKLVSRLFYLAYGSVGQSCTTLCTAASQNLAAIRGCHTLPEAMLHLAVPLLRLICSFHENVTPFLLYHYAACSGSIGLQCNIAGSLSAQCRYKYPCKV